MILDAPVSSLSGAQLLGVVGVSIALFLVLILRFKIQAFVSLLITSIVAGLLSGMETEALIQSIKSGLGNPGMGALIIVIGLGGIFGALLEHSGGAQTIADYMLKALGVKNAPLALLLAGFVIAIPVFFDVAFIILVPVIFALQKQTGKSLLHYAIPLLCGLAITHTFIPPTPGPILVADMVGADLGVVILMGFAVGLPTALISGLWFGKYIGGKIHLEIPDQHNKGMTHGAQKPSIVEVLSIIFVPIILIVLSTLQKMEVFNAGKMHEVIQVLGEPIVALLVANLLAWYFLGVKKGTSKKTLMELSSRSLGSVGVIILVTGAGAVFKQVLTDTGAGVVLAETITDLEIPVIVFGFIAAAIVRVLQGSATVAMITAAGLVAPLCESGYSSMQLALIVLSVASGASIFSHVNDSGFWLVSQYLGMTEKQTFKSWTIMTTLFGVVGFLLTIIFWSIS